VDEKIKLYFGKQCGLSIHSEVGQGTSIYILLPYAPKSEGGDFNDKSSVG
jgi:sensor histidine kinase YesM